VGSGFATLCALCFRLGLERRFVITGIVGATVEIEDWLKAREEALPTTLDAAVQMLEREGVIVNPQCDRIRGMLFARTVSAYASVKPVFLDGSPQKVMEGDLLEEYRRALIALMAGTLR
jgi:hypothetical protein